MQSGDLNRRIIIGNTVVTTNDNAFESENFVEFCGAWAKINGLSNREFYTNKTTEQEDILNFTIRYRKNLDESMQIQYNNKAYEITGIDDYMEQHQFLTLRGRRVVQSV